MLIGYGRVSTAEQNPAHQVDALRRAGVRQDDVHLDVASGSKASRPKLDLVLALLREGDTLVITRLDRLGRSVVHLVTLGAQLRERGIGLRVIEQGIDTATVEGRAMFGMLSVLAELQRELIVANTRDGLAAARARGRVGGRPPRLSPDQVRQAQRLYDEGEHTAAQIAAMFGVSRGTLYGHLDTAGRVRATTSPTPTAIAPGEQQPAAAVPGVVVPDPAHGCPTCGDDPGPGRGRWQQQRDLAVLWLYPDPAAPDGIEQRRHCAACQPHRQVEVLGCVRCGDGPMLTGGLAAGTERGPLTAWLRTRSWIPDQRGGWTCPQH